MDDENNSPQSKGGKARAERMSAADRSRIASEAAKQRWGGSPPKAISGTLEKPINIAGIKVPCFVLDDGRRVITMAGVTDTLHIARGGSMKRGMSRLEFFVSGKLIKPFVSNGLYERVRSPVRFKLNKLIAYGFDSDTLIDIAEAVIAADNAGVLQQQQRPIAHQCRIITSGLTRLGLIALIDEATGYQAKRASDELQRILEAYVLPEHRRWVQTIPTEFMCEVNRVYGWKQTQNNRGPRYAGKLIRQFVYERLPKPVLPSLDEKNPSNSRHQRKHKHHQFLTAEMGLDHFRTQIISVMALLRASPDKHTFKALFRRAFAKQIEMDFGEFRS